MSKFIQQNFIRLLILTTLCVLPNSLLAQEIKLSELSSSPNLDITNRIETFQTSDSLDPKELITTDKFTQNVNNEIKRNYTDNSLWLRFSVYNDTDSKEEKIVYLTSTLSGFLELYKLNEKGGVLTRSKSGNSLPYKFKKSKSIQPSFIIDLDSKEKAVILIKRKSRHRLDTRVFISEKDSFQSSDNKKVLILVFYLGAILSILLYNLFIFFYSRDKIYILYCLFAGSLSLLIVNLQGGLDFILRPQNFNFSEYVLFFSASALLCTLIFAYKFLKISLYIPKVRKLYFLLISNATLHILIVFTPLFKKWAHILGPTIDLSIAVSLLFILITTFLSIRKKNLMAKFYLASFIFIFASALIWFGMNLGFFPKNIFTTNSLLIGNVFEMITIALGLAYKITFIDSAKEQIKKETLLHQKYLRLSRVLSHDISNSLFIITGFSKRVLRTPNTVNKLETWEKVSRASKNITNILNQVRLELSENESLTLSEVKFNSIIKESQFTFENQLQEKNLKIVNNLPNSLSVFANTTSLLNHVVNNVISNAIKFSRPSSSITVSYMDSPSHKVIVFSDTGVGIPEEKISKFMHTKYMYSTKGTRGEEGSGQGMRLLHNYMEKFGGFLEIESKTIEGNSGTTIKLFFPKLS